MKYGWIITKDHLYKEGESFIEDEAGIIGPRDIPDNLLDKLKKGRGRAFKMYDDDGILYYSGRIVFADGSEMEAGLSEEAFGPLDDFGRPNAGAIAIKYRNPQTKKWEML